MKVKNLANTSDTFDFEFPPKPYDIVGFGSNSADQLCVVPEYPSSDSKTEILQYERLPGGQVATAAIFLAHMGLKARYIGKLGGDEAGRLMLQSLRSEDIDISNVIVEEKALNNYAIIIIDKRTGGRTIFCRRDELLDFRDSELREEDVCAGRILHIDGYDPLSLKAASWCRERGIAVSADLDNVVPGCKELLTKVDFLIASADFPAKLTGISDPEKSFVALKGSFDGFLAVTLGAEGAMAWVGGRCVVFPGLKVKAVDTTGAGDIFHGGFLYGLLRNWPLGKIMAFANAAAGLSCGFLGARTGIRPLPEILCHADRLLGAGAGGGSDAPV